MNGIFADLHHGGLYHSLQLLANRLGLEIYRPIGEEWFHEGYWKIAEPYGNHPDTIKQYLSTEPYELVNHYCNTGAQEIHPGYYSIQDEAHNGEHKALTFECFKDTKFDVLLVSYPWHLESWIQLQKKYQPQAKLVLQVGNNGWQNFFSAVNNVLSSARHAHVPKHLNYVEYHQEFELDIFKPDPELQTKSIRSFVNCLPVPDIYNSLKASLPEFFWQAFGHGCPDGVVTGIDKIATYMKMSRWGYHVKPGGDGYGHVLHNWFACGVPLITVPTHYRGTLGEDLLEENVTCITPDTENIRQSNYKLPYDFLRNNVIKRFHDVVNFDDEYQNRLKPFFENLK